MDYRRGDRSVQQFHRERRAFEWAEEQFMRLLQETEESDGRHFQFHRTNDDSGEITDARHLHKIRIPDFEVDCVWKRGLIEVKTHERWWEVARGRIKVSSLRGCIDHDADLLMIDPRGFYWFTTQDLRRLLREATQTSWRWGETEAKPSVLYDATTVKHVWYQFWNPVVMRRAIYTFACARLHQRNHQPQRRPKMSLQHRRDHRDEDAFARDIKKGTAVEHAIMQLLCEADPSMTYEDCGVDSSGEVIQDKEKDPSASMPDFELPDYCQVTSQLLGTANVHLEVKTHPLWHKKPVGHIKLGSLRGCLDVGAFLLMADMDGFYLFSPTGLLSLVREGTRIARWSGGGGKPAMQYTDVMLVKWSEEEGSSVVRRPWPAGILHKVQQELSSLMAVRREATTCSKASCLKTQIS